MRVINLPLTKLHAEGYMYMCVFFKRLSDDVTSMSGDLDNVAKYTRNFIFVGTYSTNLPLP
jgi:hypothetical protein